MEKRRSDLQDEAVVVNPFLKKANRDNFPGWDQALAEIAIDDDDNDSKLPPSQQQHYSFYDDRASPDQSICSYASSSLLNMSIGARAALNEHLRHVAIHGIDGQASPAETSVLSHERLPQDEVWERLLDGNLSITSASAPSLFDRLQCVVSISEDGEEAIEVLDVSDSGSSDFFNSSKIWQLATPEKNRGVRRPITTKRGDEQYEESDSESQASGMMYLYNVAVGMHEASHHSIDAHNSSFLSLGVDLSRISNSDVSDVRSSPDDVSFHQRVFEDADICTPSRRNSSLIRDQSFSTPSRRGLLSPEPSLFSPSRRSVSTIRGSDLSAADIGLSPIAAQAGSIAVKLGRRHSRRHHPGEAFPLLSASPLKIMEHEPSPISQANSAFHFPETVSEHCILDMDDDKRDKSGDSSVLLGLKPRERLSTSPDKQASPASLSTISAQPSVSKQQQHSSSASSSDDRRRYRTVVPARVFMDEPDEFPFQQDSFCSSHSETVESTTSEHDSDTSTSPLQRRSLLVSFDAAADEFEVPLNDS